MSKPPVNNCQRCMSIAVSAKSKSIHKTPVAVAVVSPTGKAHWRGHGGWTFCGLDAIGWNP